MTMQGYQQAYQQVQNVTEDPRQTEYRLFAQVTGAMIRAEDLGHTEIVRAVHWNRRLWLALQSDCATEDNSLPDATRAGIISLAIWVDKHCRKVLKREADLQPMIEVNRNIMEGLSGG
ncbi:MAG: flagellar biosynthesis regulator FlaF [Rhodospirillaceae bacterium]|jgi:flagellar biosynthesis activator protein FlaF|nr:flagellar biosynthesis regulator FlaF [Rhodospirillaceae bacterium]MBT4490089.1 flagellar biosynthesis regulator FlaF [Rhodospirillaceae bacterium]MBT5193398.1 flagellar biosynthesis regulator FlaF [Rhodospirillaceae bacterium]MBT5896139.1 flagellar biosynthesis regulator FlaF [Rhodospirillaceae bacterium]MBT6426531.1 flagellar biosynthesis regulator FlaF [Rhodospirillaceae bacterium]